MTTDQPTRARSRLLLADAFTRDRAATTKPDPHDLATWLLDQLQNLGWRPPPDPTDTPPLRPAQPAADDGPGRQAFRQAREALARRRAGQPPAMPATTATNPDTGDTPT